MACYRYQIFSKALKRVQADSQVCELAFLSVSDLMMMMKTTDECFLCIGAMML